MSVPVFVFADPVHTGAFGFGKGQGDAMAAAPAAEGFASQSQPVEGSSQFASKSQDIRSQSQPELPASSGSQLHEEAQRAIVLATVVGRQVAAQMQSVAGARQPPAATNPMSVLRSSVADAAGADVGGDVLVVNLPNAMRKNSGSQDLLGRALGKKEATLRHHRLAMHCMWIFGARFGGAATWTSSGAPDTLQDVLQNDDYQSGAGFFRHTHRMLGDPPAGVSGQQKAALLAAVSGSSLFSLDELPQKAPDSEFAKVVSGTNCVAGVNISAMTPSVKLREWNFTRFSSGFDLMTTDRAAKDIDLRHLAGVVPHETLVLCELLHAANFGSCVAVLLEEEQAGRTKISWRPNDKVLGAGVQHVVLENAFQSTAAATNMTTTVPSPPPRLPGQNLGGAKSSGKRRRPEAPGSALLSDTDRVAHVAFVEQVKQEGSAAKRARFSDVINGTVTEFATDNAEPDRPLVRFQARGMAAIEIEQVTVRAIVATGDSGIEFTVSVAARAVNVTNNDGPVRQQKVSIMRALEAAKTSLADAKTTYSRVRTSSNKATREFFQSQVDAIQRRLDPYRDDTEDRLFVGSVVLHGVDPTRVPKRWHHDPQRGEFSARFFSPRKTDDDDDDGDPAASVTPYASQDDDAGESAWGTSYWTRGEGW
jgi:hypothetical protein